MALEWSDSLETMDWDELSNLYRIAPLGNKKAADLKVVFTKLGFKRMLTAMAIFANQEEAVRTGLVTD